MPANAAFYAVLRIEFTAAFAVSGTSHGTAHAVFGLFTVQTVGCINFKKAFVFAFILVAGILIDAAEIVIDVIAIFEINDDVFGDLNRIVTCDPLVGKHCGYAAVGRIVVIV